MLSRLLQDLIADVRTLADIVGQTAAITDTMITEWINKGLFEVHVAYVTAGGLKMVRKTGFVTTDGVATEYALPADFMELLSVEMPINGGDRVTLEPFTPLDRPYLLSATPGWDGEPMRYAIQGKPGLLATGTIELLPKAAAGITVYLYYAWQPIRLVNPATDGFDGVAGYEDYAIVYAVQRCAVKEENYELAAWCANEMARVKANILAGIRSRDANAPSRILMTRQTWRPRGMRRRYWG